MVAMGRTRREGEAAQALALGRIRRNVNRWPPSPLNLESPPIPRDDSHASTFLVISTPYFIYTISHLQQNYSSLAAWPD